MRLLLLEKDTRRSGVISVLRILRLTRTQPFRQYHPGIFKIAILDRWLVVVTGAELIEDIRKAPEDELSFISATKEASSKFVAYFNTL